MTTITKATDRITYHTICGSNPPMKSTEINTVQSLHLLFTPNLIYNGTSILHLSLGKNTTVLKIY